jgi:hypothetical protein
MAALTIAGHAAPVSGRYCEQSREIYDRVGIPDSQRLGGLGSEGAPVESMTFVRKGSGLMGRRPPGATLPPRCTLSVTRERATRFAKSRGGAPMATIQAAIFWIMLALTPSMILVGVLLMRARLNQDSDLEDLNSSQKLEFDNQPPYPSTQ